MQKLIQEILQEYNKAFLPRLNETQPVEVLFDFELITIREVVSLHTTVNPFTPVGAHRVTYRFYCLTPDDFTRHWGTPWE